MGVNPASYQSQHVSSKSKECVRLSAIEPCGSASASSWRKTTNTNKKERTKRYGKIAAPIINIGQHTPRAHAAYLRRRFHHGGISGGQVFISLRHIPWRFFLRPFTNCGTNNSAIWSACRQRRLRPCCRCRCRLLLVQRSCLKPMMRQHIQTDAQWDVHTSRGGQGRWGRANDACCGAAESSKLTPPNTTRTGGCLLSAVCPAI